MHNALFPYLIGEKWNEITVSNREPNYGLMSESYTSVNCFVYVGWEVGASRHRYIGSVMV